MVSVLLCMDVAKDTSALMMMSGATATGTRGVSEVEVKNVFRTTWIDGDEDLLQLTGWVDFKGYLRWPF